MPKTNTITRNTVQSWLLLTAGIVGLAVIFYFGYDSDLSIRVALGLAAAAIAAYIPGFLEVKSHFLRGGGAIAVMIVVLFADDIGRQFSPKSKAPGVPSTVKVSKDQLQYLSELAAAQFDISQKRYSVAIETLEHARALGPDPKLALNMLGTLHFTKGHYAKAAEAYEQGFRPGDPDGGRLAYNAALAHQAVGDTTEALKWIDLAHRNTPRDGHLELWREVTFDRGLIHMKAWLESDAPKLSRMFEIAVSSFHQFLDAESKLVHWAEYGIACLHATSATNQVTRNLPPGERYDRAVRHFEKFLQNLDGLDLEDQGEAIKLARTVLDIDHNGKRELAGPVECPAIREAWVGIGRDWDKLVGSKLSLESKARAASL